MFLFQLNFRALLVCLLLFCNSGIQAQSDRIELQHANVLEYDQRATGKVKRLIGDVRFKQKNTLLQCDSAYQFEQDNRVEAYGNVFINHNDSLYFRSKKLEYDGNNRKATLQKDVRMYDQSMDLTTDYLYLDLNTNTGYYTTGGVIRSGENNLKSKSGYYYSNRQELFFKKDVVLTNPKYTIDCDTLKYNTRTRIAYFYGPTTITGSNKKLYCEWGEFNTVSDLAWFSRNAYIQEQGKLFRADSMFYDNNKEYGKAWRHLQIIDSVNKMVLYGNEGELFGKLKQHLITKDAVAKQYFEKDSMYLFSDTIHAFQETPTQRGMVKSYPNVTVIKTDMQARCDSMVYEKSDSTLTLFEHPIIWSGLNQATGDTIKMFINNSKLDSFWLMNNAFLISREGAKEYNQVKGKRMSGQLEESRFKYMRVLGNAQSIHYVKEDSAYLGINVINCSEIEFYFLNNKIDRSNFLTQPDAVFYPLNELKPEELRLKGFKWRHKERPDWRYFFLNYVKKYN